MSQGSVSVVPIFATPLGVVTLPAASTQSGPAVAQLLARHAAANPAPATADRLCYHSRDDLLEWSEEPIQQLCGEILRGIWSTVAAVTTLSPEELQTLSMQARAAVHDRAAGRLHAGEQSLPVCLVRDLLPAGAGANSATRRQRRRAILRVPARHDAGRCEHERHAHSIHYPDTTHGAPFRDNSWFSRAP